MFFSAVLNALDSKISQEAIKLVSWAIENDSKDYRAILVDLGDNGLLDSECGQDIDDFVKRGYSALAFNLEKCGRPLDAAKIYEEQLKMYEKAKLLREKDRQMIVKRTEVSVNLNELLKQIKDGGIVAVYRCPNCNGTLKINNKTSLKSLKPVSIVVRKLRLLTWLISSKPLCHNVEAKTTVGEELRNIGVGVGIELLPE